MSDKPPKGKVIDITGLLKIRRIGWTPRNTDGRPQADGNEIPPPPPVGRLHAKTVIPSRPKEQGNLVRALDVISPAVQIKKLPFVRQLILKLPEWITPNLVTVFRTLFAIPIIMLGRNDQRWWTGDGNGHYWLILGLFLFASFLDFVDGAIAHARNSGSIIGEFLDPLGDKIVVFCTIFAVGDRLFWPWLPTIMLFAVPLAIILTMNRLYKLWCGDRSVAANPAGKLKLVLETAGVSFCLLGLALGTPMLITIGLTMFSLATGLAVLSLAGQLS